MSFINVDEIAVTSHTLIKGYIDTEGFSKISCHTLNDSSLISMGGSSGLRNWYRLVMA